MFRNKKPELSADPDDLVVLVERTIDPYLVVFHEPTGYRAEQFRGLRNKLITMNPDGSPKTLVVASSIKEEGKTVTAANLAIAFAEMERTPILLVDFDLRSPSVERYLNVNSEPGVADVLLGRSSLDEVVRSVGVRNLSIIGAGSRAATPSELLTGPRIHELFARLKERFQYVIIDTPPALSATDASVIAAQADGTLMVVRLERSQKSMTRDALRTLQELGANVLGTFVTEERGMNPEADPRLGYANVGEEVD